MRYNKIRKMDISDGPGVRVSIFMQGCTFNCKNCFNPETHDFKGGKEFNDETIKRVLEYWDSDIKPELKKGKKIIIAAHGNSLRGLIKYLDNISDEDIIKLELQTGNPICYELDDDLKPINHYYLK